MARSADLWWQCSGEAPTPEQTFSALQRFKHRKGMETFRKRLGIIANQLAEDTPVKAQLIEALRQLESSLSLKGGIPLQFFQHQGYHQATWDFLKMVEDFDPHMSFYDIFQAIRNVWIMNSIQILFGMEVRVTPSIFAYSMLYPYSDNYLDDQTIPREEKLAFQQRFRSWLLGQQCAAVHPMEEKIYELIQMIEGEFDRRTYPQVYESLLAIHGGQEKSLLQQQGPLIPYEGDILGITFEKGGTSVLADGYLVRGNLTHQESVFLFQYGVLLQLIDDLQDCETDRRAGHMTLFSVMKNRIPLDQLVNKLWHLIPATMDGIPQPGAEAEALKEVIIQCCEWMVLEAMVHHPRAFTRGYFKQMKAMVPLPKGYVKRMKKKFQQTLAPEAAKALLQAWLRETEAKSQIGN